MAHDGAEKSRRGWGRAAASRACRCWAAGWTGRRRLRHQAGLAGTPRAGSTGARPQRARTSRVPRAVHGTGGHAPATNRARAGTTGVPPHRARPRRAPRARFGTGAGIRQLGSTGVGGNACGGRGRHGCAHAPARPTSASAALLATVVSARACDTGKRRKVAPRLIAAPAASGCTPCWAGGPHVLWHRTTLAARRVYTGACIAVRRR